MNSTPPENKRKKKIVRGLLPFFQAALILTAFFLLPDNPPTYNALLVIIVSGIVLAGGEILGLFIGHRPTKRVCRLGTFLWLLGALPCTSLELLGLNGLPSPAAVACGVLLTLVISLFMLRTSVREGVIEKVYVKWPSRLLLIAFSILSSVVILECVAGPFIPDFTYKVKPDPDCSFEMISLGPDREIRLNPGFHGTTQHSEFYGIPVTLNSDGYRDRPWKAAAEGEGVCRILGLGDSFTFGTGVKAQETYLRCIEGMAERKGRILTFNSGVPGHGPLNHYFTLEKLADRLQPQIVIMGLYTGNDLSDSLRFIKNTTMGDRDIDAIDSGQKLESRKTRVHLNQTLRRMANYKYWTMESKICSLVLPAMARVLVAARLISPRLICNTFLVETCALEPEAKVRQAFLFTKEAVRRIHQFCTERAMHFMVILIPPVMMIDERLFDRIVESYPKFRGREFDRDIVHRNLCSDFDRNGIPHLDLLPFLRERFKEGEKFQHDEGHWNAVGHKIAAERILGFVSDQGWLEESIR